MTVPTLGPKRGRRIQGGDQKALNLVQMLKVKDMIVIEVLPNEESDSDYKPSAFSWDVTSYSDHNMEIKLNWAEPSQIS